MNSIRRIHLLISNIFFQLNELIQSFYPKQLTNVIFIVVVVDIQQTWIHVLQSSILKFIVGLENTNSFWQKK